MLSSLTPTRAILGFCTLFLATLLISSLLAWPSADDFCYFNRFSEGGILPTLKEEYLLWGGRYASMAFTGLASSVPGLLSGFGYFVVPFAVLASLVGGVAVLFWLGFGRIHYGCILSGSTLLIASMSWREGIYWMAGGITYGLGTAAMLASAGCILGLVKLSHLGLAATAVLVFLSAGFNEGNALFQLMLIAGIAGIAVSKGRFDELGRLGIVGLFAFAGLAVEFSAPGNFVRSTAMGHDIVWAEGLNGLLYPFSYLVVGLGFYVAWRMIFAIWTPPSPPITLPYGTYGALVLTYLLLLPGLTMRALLLSGPGPERALTSDCAIVWLGTLIAAMASQPKQNETLRHNNNWTAVLIFCLVCLTITGASSEPMAQRWESLVRQARHVDQAMSQRLELYGTRTGQDVIVSPLRPKWKASPTIQADITPDPANWINACVAQSYKLKSLRVAEGLTHITPR